MSFNDLFMNVASSLATQADIEAELKKEEERLRKEALGSYAVRLCALVPGDPKGTCSTVPSSVRFL
jgi:hypothetical protein